jgi:hypothetical protein
MSVAILAAWVAGLGAASAQVRVSVENGRATLTRNGKPFLIKGAGGDGSKQLLVQCGGNAFRTWGADKLGEALDEAQRLGLTVAAGIWLGHERHGFRYTDVEQVAAQQEMVREVVLKYRKHPALLMWSLGNEMEGDGSNAAIWTALNSMAAMVKRLDPDHPVMTVIAEIGDKVRALHRLCPEIDVVGINAYAGASSVAERYAKAGGTRPFVLTEFGPPGTWEVEKTPWGAPIEPTSTAKADWYRRAWQSVTASPLCLGAFSFAWGHKQETTATWFGMLLPDGSRLGAVDTMTEMWTGKPPANRCPVIASLKADGPTEGDLGGELRLSAAVSDPDGDALKVRWLLQAESARYSSGGDAEAAPPIIEGAVVRSSNTDAVVRLPATAGAYRVLLYVTDGRGGAATANVPVRVKGAATAPDAPAAALPMILYADGPGDKPPFVPSGWMGNAGAVKMDQDCADRPATGSRCIRCDYTASGDWAGVVWQNPENDWGDQPGGWNLTGATRLVWRARGARGGEAVSFFFGIIGKEKPFPDSATGRLDNARLTSEWTEFSIPLAGKDLSRIKTGFGWTVAGQGAPVTFYLDDIRFER